MNYIVSSIVLLVIVIIIIYILSIDNNIDKLRNKFKDIFKVAKSKDINYMNNKDSLILLTYLKKQYNMFDNVMIPKKIFYNKIDDYYIIKNIDMIGYKITGNNINETSQNISIKFIPINNELFIGQYSLFGLNGNYYIINDSIPENMPKNMSENMPKNMSENMPKNMPKNIPDNMPKIIPDNMPKIIPDNMPENNNSSDMIPDIIQLSSDVDD